MEKFAVHILGCGSALPTQKHNPSSQIIEYGNKCFMVDCGEGTQLQLRRARIHFMKVSGIFISHLHGDHCFGLIGLISTFGMLGRTAPLHIYAPKELENVLNAQLEFFCYGLDYEIKFHPIDTLSKTIIYEDNSLKVSTLPLQHRVPCSGFLFEEKEKLPHIRRDMIDFYHIPISQINNIKLGKNWVTEDGETIPYTQLTTPPEKCRSYAYCSDTRYMPSLSSMIKDVTVLYHESTYLKQDSSLANQYFHSTAEDAAKIALKARAERLILGHYSSRYNNENVFLEEASRWFPNVGLANEGMILEL